MWLGLIAALSVRCVSPGEATETPRRPGDHDSISYGRIVGFIRSANGSAIPRATMVIWEARPKRGASLLCVTCYPECGRTSVSDREGRAVLDRLNPRMSYALLATAPGFEPTLIRGVPGDTSISISLPTEGPPSPEGGVLRGRVEDPDGQPVAGVRLTPIGLILPDRKRFGGLPSTSPMSLTDSAGRFALKLGDSSGTYIVRLERPGYAPRIARLALANKDSTSVRLALAVTAKGRIGLSPRTRAGVRIIASQCDLGAETSLGRAEVMTDSRGYFVLGGLAQSTDYFVYAHSSGVPADVYCPKVRLRTPDYPAVVSVDLHVRREGARLRGRLRLPSGQPPDSLEAILVASDSILDATQVRVGRDGTFRSRLLAPEPLWLVFGTGSHLATAVSDSTAQLMDDRVYFPAPPRGFLEITIQPQSRKGGP